MRPDIAAGIVMVLMTVLGGVISIHAPGNTRQKWIYASIFACLGIVGMYFVIKQSNETATVNERLLSSMENITGGDSYAYLTPQPSDDDGNVPLAIRSVGRNTLTGVQVTIHDFSQDASLREIGRQLNIGVLPRDTLRLVEGVSLKASKQAGDRIYRITVSAQNGTFEEVIVFRTPAFGGVHCLADHVSVTKSPTISEIGPKPPTILLNQDWHSFFRCDRSK